MTKLELCTVPGEDSCNWILRQDFRNAGNSFCGRRRGKWWLSVEGISEKQGHAFFLIKQMQ